jgi:hypothetical protein
MVLGLIGGTFASAAPVVELYRQAGAAAGHPADSLWLGLTSHFFIGPTSQGSRGAFYPHYREYLRPKTPGGRGWAVSPDDSAQVASPAGALMIGSPQKSLTRSRPNAPSSALTASWARPTWAGCRPAWSASPSSCSPPRSPR